MTIRKAVIPAAGFGTRMLPAAKAIPKEMLPIVDRPTIQYVVEECAAAGIGDVLLVNSPDKTATERHFAPHPELEQRLKASGKQALLASVASLIAGVRIHVVHQPQPRGLGDAVLQAKASVGDEPFLCLLGDTVFSGEPSPAAQLLRAAGELGTTVIGLEEVAADKVDRYGIVAGDVVGEGVLRLHTVIEKPHRDSAPSRYAIAARYVLTPAIFACLEATPPSAGGEVQLTDALRLQLSREPIHGVVLRARRHDIGNPIDWLRTNIAFAWRDPQLRAQLAPLLASLLRERP
jgi:UTP--glucose-1-phosphate uridylyltransferase